jgi:hypothetical protein
MRYFLSLSRFCLLIRRRFSKFLVLVKLISAIVFLVLELILLFSVVKPYVTLMFSACLSTELFPLRYL